MSDFYDMVESLRRKAQHIIITTGEHGARMQPSITDVVFVTNPTPKDSTYTVTQAKARTSRPDSSPVHFHMCTDFANLKVHE